MEDKYYKYNLLYHKLSCTNEQTPMLLANFLLAAKAVRLYLVLLLLFPKQVQSAEGLDCLKSTLDVCSIACTLPPCCLRFLSKSIFFRRMFNNFTLAKSLSSNRLIPKQHTYGYVSCIRFCCFPSTSYINSFVGACDFLLT